MVVGLFVAIFVLLCVITFLVFRSKNDGESSGVNVKQETLRELQIHGHSIVSNIEALAVFEVVREIEMRGEGGLGVIIKPFSEGSLPSGKKLDLERSGINRAAPLLQQLPNALIANEALNGKYMEVIVNGDLAAVKGTTDVFHPIVKGENGKIIEQAKLKDPKSLQNIAKLNVAFQLVSVAVAQKHLADISKSLDQLKEDVSEIKAFQENERYSKITGAIDYLHQLEKAVQNGELDISVRSKFEDIEYEILGIQHHLEIDINSKINSILILEDQETFGTEDTFTEMKARQEQLQDLLFAWSECALTRAYACTLLSAFPGNRVLISARVDAIKSSISALVNEVLPRCAKVTYDRLEKINSIFNKNETINIRKKDVGKYLEASNLRFDVRSKRIEGQLVKMDDLYSDQLNTLGTRMILDVEGGSINEAYLLDR